MDIQSAATQLLNYLGNNPEKLSQLAQHPYSTTAAATGTNETISQKDMSQVLAQVAAQVSGQQLSTGQAKDLASTLLGQTGSVHTMASTLFGGASTAATTTATGSAGPSMAEIMAKSVAGGLAARGLATLLTTAMNAKKQQQ